MRRGAGWRDRSLLELLELTDLIDDDEHGQQLRDELEARAVWREAAQAVYDEQHPELGPPWWAAP